MALRYTLAVAAAYFLVHSPPVHDGLKLGFPLRSGRSVPLIPAPKSGPYVLIQDDTAF